MCKYCWYRGKLHKYFESVEGSFYTLDSGECLSKVVPLDPQEYDYILKNRENAHRN